MIPLPPIHRPLEGREHRVLTRRSRRSVTRSHRASIATVLAGVVLTAGAASAQSLGVQQNVYQTTPGSYFVVTFQVTNPEASPLVVGYDYVITSNAVNAFSVTQQQLAGPISDKNFSLMLPYQITGTASGAADFGATSSGMGVGVGQGTTTVQTLQIGVSEQVAPGTYTINFGWNFPEAKGPSLVLADGSEIQMQDPLTITVIVNSSVIPEPATLALAFGSVLLVGLRRRR